MTVALNKTEILHRAHGFVKDYADARYEMGEAQNFIRGLCDVFGFSNKRLVSFERRSLGLWLCAMTGAAHGW